MHMTAMHIIISIIITDLRSNMIYSPVSFEFLMKSYYHIKTVLSIAFVNFIKKVQQEGLTKCQPPSDCHF
jgi:hypothetical protein